MENSTGNVLCVTPLFRCNRSESEREHKQKKQHIDTFKRGATLEEACRSVSCLAFGSSNHISFSAMEHKGIKLNSALIPIKNTFVHFNTPDAITTNRSNSAPPDVRYSGIIPPRKRKTRRARRKPRPVKTDDDIIEEFRMWARTELWSEFARAKLLMHQVIYPIRVVLFSMTLLMTYSTDMMLKLLVFLPGLHCTDSNTVLCPPAKRLDLPFHSGGVL